MLKPPMPRMAKKGNAHSQLAMKRNGCPCSVSADGKAADTPMVDVDVSNWEAEE